MIKHIILFPLYVLFALVVVFSLFLVFWFLPTEFFGHMELWSRVASHGVYAFSVLWTLLALYYLVEHE